MTLRTRAMTVHVRQLKIASEMDDSARVDVGRLISIDGRAKSVVAPCARGLKHHACERRPRKRTYSKPCIEKNCREPTP